MRWAGLLVLLTVAVALELHYLGGDDRGSPARAAAGQTPAERGLTLLDYWSQELVPAMLLQRARARALRRHDSARAARLEPRLRRGLLLVRGFGPAAAHELGAVRATGAAWSEWAQAILGRAARARGVARLEANAVRLHQAAYAVVDASLRPGGRAQRRGR